MQDMDSDLLNFYSFFAPNNDENVDDLWDLAAAAGGGQDDDLLDAVELEPLSPTLKDDPHEEEAQAPTKPEADNKHGLKLDTKLINNSKEGWMAQYENVKANGTPTATLPARFALLSTTCVYEPGFTTSPRGKRRISQTRAEEFELQDYDKVEGVEEEGEEGEEEEGEEETEGDGDDEPFMLSSDDYNLPVFTDAELNAMVESPSKVSTASTASAAPSPSRALDEAMSDVPDVISMFSSIYDSSQNFLVAQQQAFDLANSVNSSSNGNTSSSVTATILSTANQALFPGAPVLPCNAASTVSPASASNDTATTNSSSLPFDYFSPSGYAAAANQFLDSYGQQVQPFFLNPDMLSPGTKAALFPGQLGQQSQANTNAQLAAAMAIANSAVMANPVGAVNLMRKINSSYGVPIAPMQRRAGSMPPTAQIKVAAQIKPRLPVQRAASTTSVVAAATSAAGGSKMTRLAITPDIADFKLVQIFHQFCDPATKVLTPPRFQQLLLHHQVKEDTTASSSSSSDTKHINEGSCCGATPATANGNAVVDAQTLFKTLDINNIGALDLERFMHSFQICNRCTEAKRRAHQALCASQGQTFTPTALERQLMEDVAPVVVRVVPTRFEGHKVKSCEHYQWTWCEGFEKTGNEKCRGTNRHDKCPKYLANCTLWKHKLPPKSRKPKLLLENVDSPTKKLNSCCCCSKRERTVEDLLDGSLEDKLLGKRDDEVEATTAEEEAWRQRREQLKDEAELSLELADDSDNAADAPRNDKPGTSADTGSLIWDLSDRNTVRAGRKEAGELVDGEEDEEAFGSAKEDANDEEEDADSPVGRDAAEEEYSGDRLTELSARSEDDSYASVNEYFRENDTRVFRDSDVDRATVADSFLGASSPSRLRATANPSFLVDDDDETQQQELQQQKEEQDEQAEDESSPDKSRSSSSSSSRRRSSKKKSRSRKSSRK
ncbi:unnamed protein product [Phytophthora fragariaefolia]|uniref:Unnamed protein product n=1 Tax=Phytophthora fragariaefolia TaxID=1490495 RepID=A0A9W6XU36_9STRA|nr:unnamed protein product [Phytophthora fragariaefolia]